MGRVTAKDPARVRSNASGVEMIPRPRRTGLHPVPDRLETCPTCQGNLDGTLNGTTGRSERIASTLWTAIGSLTG